MNSSTDRKQSYRDSIDRAMKWILSHQEEDGSFGEIISVSHYMALGASLHFNGYDDEASRLMPIIKKTYIAEDGDFVPPTKEASLRELYYAPSWAIYSAHLCSALDISMPGIAHVLKFQDPQTGGIFGSAQAHDCGKGIIHPAVTSLGGLAALATGHLPEAKRMADHIVDNLIAKNPDLNKAFYPAWHTESGVWTGDDLPISTNMPNVLLRDEPGQHHFLTGMMIAFLSELYRTTEDRKYLDGALTLYEFSAGGTPAIYENTLSHKFAWGCAWLYRQTGQAEHLESACRLCDYFVSIQEADGTFAHLGAGFPSANFPYSPRMGVTSQFALWMRHTLDVLY